MKKASHFPAITPPIRGPHLSENPDTTTIPKKAFISPPF